MSEEFLTQSQFEQIGRMVEKLVKANVWASLGDERLFLRRMADVSSRHGLTREKAQYIIDQLIVRWPKTLEEFKEKGVAL